MATSRSLVMGPVLSARTQDMPLNMRPSGSAVITTQPASNASICSSWPVVRPMMRPSRSTAMSVMPSTGVGGFTPRR